MRILLQLSSLHAELGSNDTGTSYGLVDLVITILLELVLVLVCDEVLSRCLSALLMRRSLFFFLGLLFSLLRLLRGSLQPPSEPVDPAGK